MNVVDLSLVGKRIGMIDADLLDTYSNNQSKRIPNLALLKLSGYFKKNNQVELVEDYTDLEDDELQNKYDVLFMAKVFTRVVVPQKVLDLPNLVRGGTGFFFDQAEPLPEVIEHHMPDYTLYLPWVERQLRKGEKPQDMDVFKNYSIGFTTRGCFRRCSFCVNKNSRKVVPHSPVSEFLDPTRRYIMLLDDNILGCSSWKKILTDLKESGKTFVYKQGMDIRIMTEEKAKMLADCPVAGGDVIFAFDNYADKEQIEKGLEIWRKHTARRTKLFILCAFDHNGKWDEDFYHRDMIETFERITFLMKYLCTPYIMRYEAWEKAPEPYKGMYINIKRWCNMPSLFKSMSFRAFCETSGGKTLKTMQVFERNRLFTAKKYFNRSWTEYQPRKSAQKAKVVKKEVTSEAEGLFD